MVHVKLYATGRSHHRVSVLNRKLKSMLIWASRVSPETFEALPSEIAMAMNSIESSELEYIYITDRQFSCMYAERSKGFLLALLKLVLSPPIPHADTKNANAPGYRIVMRIRENADWLTKIELVAPPDDLLITCIGPDEITCRFYTGLFRSLAVALSQLHPDEIIPGSAYLDMVVSAVNRNPPRTVYVSNALYRSKFNIRISLAFPPRNSASLHENPVVPQEPSYYPNI